MAARPTAEQIIEQLTEVYGREIQSAFLAAIAGVVDAVLFAVLVEAIVEGDIAKAFRSLGFTPAAMRPITAAIERAYEAGGIGTGSTFPRVLNTPSGRTVYRFDTRSIRAEQWLRTNAASKIDGWTTQAESNIRSVMVDGLAAGRNPRSIALDIVGRVDPVTHKRVGGVVGLSSNQKGWVDNVRAALTEGSDAYFNYELRDKRSDSLVRTAFASGKGLSAADIERLTTRYKDNALRWRGENIGRSEAIEALNAANHEAYKQAEDSGAIQPGAIKRYWDSAGHDGRTRDSHLELDRKYEAAPLTNMDEPFVSPSTGARMMYPGDKSLGAPASETAQCRCRPKILVDWLAGVT